MLKAQTPTDRNCVNPNILSPELKYRTRDSPTRTSAPNSCYFFKQNTSESKLKMPRHL